MSKTPLETCVYIIVKCVTCCCAVSTQVSHTISRGSCSPPQSQTMTTQGKQISPANAEGDTQGPPSLFCCCCSTLEYHPETWHCASACTLLRDWMFATQEKHGEWEKYVVPFSRTAWHFCWAVVTHGDRRGRSCDRTAGLHSSPHSVRLSNALLTPWFLRFAVQIQVLRASRAHDTRNQTHHVCLASNLRQKTRQLQHCNKPLCGKIQVLVLKNTSTNIIWPSGGSSKFEKAQKKAGSVIQHHSASSALCWILISECSQNQAGIQSKQMMDGAPTGLSLLSFYSPSLSLSQPHPDMSRWFIFGLFPLLLIVI